MLSERIAVVGLGYVGLPVAIAFARVCNDVTGFDTSTARVAQLRRGHDSTGEIDGAELSASSLKLTDDAAAIAGSGIYIVTVPTPVNSEKRPDLRPLLNACAAIGPGLVRGAVVVFESTVFPGATEEVCGPELERTSGLVAGRDFTLGYSPERINPGDREHKLETIVKVVSAQDEATLARIAAAYRAIVPAGIFEARSIRAAEAAKVIENTQRDINIALMNELAIIFERLGLRTADVLAAARTKWNFLPFSPGLVGGHCIGIDPYYLTAKAEAVGYHPEVILSGRRINDGVSRFVAQKTIKLMVTAGIDLGRARVGLLGVTFKENVPDIRNSKAPDVARELEAFGICPIIHDAMADPQEVSEEYALKLSGLGAFRELDALLLVVPHRAYLADPTQLRLMIRPGGVFVDVRSAVDPVNVPEGVTYWSL